MNTRQIKAWLSGTLSPALKKEENSAGLQTRLHHLIQKLENPTSENWDKKTYVSFLQTTVRLHGNLSSLITEHKNQLDKPTKPTVNLPTPLEHKNQSNKPASSVRKPVFSRRHYLASMRIDNPPVATEEASKKSTGTNTNPRRIKRR